MKLDVEAERTERETLTASAATSRKEDTAVAQPHRLIDSWPLEMHCGEKKKSFHFLHTEKTYMCGDEGSRVGQFVMPPHPEGEEDDGGQAYDGNQGVKQGAEELGLLGEWVGGGCGRRRDKWR